MTAGSSLERKRLREGIPTLQFGDHLYYPYDKATTQLPVLTSFVHAGLELGQQCIHVADDLSEGGVTEALEAVGIDTAAEKEEGSLRFLTKWQWRHHEHLDPALMVEALASLVSRGHWAGYSGTRIWLDMTWALNPGVEPLQLEVWETLLHRVIQDEPVVLICSYNCRRLPTSVIKVGENTHPMRTTGDRVLPNDRSRLAALFGKHAPILRRLDPPSRPRLVDAY